MQVKTAGKWLTVRKSRNWTKTRLQSPMFEVASELRCNEQRLGLIFNMTVVTYLE